MGEIRAAFLSKKYLRLYLTFKHNLKRNKNSKVNLIVTRHQINGLM